MYSMSQKKDYKKFVTLTQNHLGEIEIHDSLIAPKGHTLYEDWCCSCQSYQTHLPQRAENLCLSRPSYQTDLPQWAKNPDCGQLDFLRETDPTSTVHIHVHTNY